VSVFLSKPPVGADSASMTQMQKDMELRETVRQSSVYLDGDTVMKSKLQNVNEFISETNQRFD
jgi:hypothetical protein